MRPVVPTGRGRSGLLAAAAWFAACAEAPIEPVNRAPVALRVPDMTIAVGQTATVDLSAYFNDPDGDTLLYTAVTSDAGVATANVSGSTLTVAGVAKGTATVTVTAHDPDGLSARQDFAVTVPNRAPEAVDSIPGVDLVAGDSTALVVSVYFGDPDGDTLTYAAVTSDAGVAGATVSGSTVTVRGAAQGTATITVSAADPEGLAAEQPIAVSIARPEPTTVVVTPDSASLTALAQTVPFAAEVSDQIGRPMPDAIMSWASGDSAVAMVDSAGLATATGNGTTFVTATAGAAAGEGWLTVRQVARSVAVSPPAARVIQGDTLRLAAEASDENGYPVRHAVFAWSSSDTSVAQVDTAGLVEGMAEGAATINAKADEAAGAAGITVLHPDREALVAFYEATGGPGWTNRRNWLTEAPVRQWYGVLAAREGRVSGLVLDDNGLSGSLPPEVGRLEGLRQLVLAENAGLSGALPVSLASLDPFERLLAGGTDLCAPSDTTLLAWLDKIPENRVARCDAAAAYLTQAVQSREFPVPLVAREEALLRVFVTAAKAGGKTIPRVRATFYRNGSKVYVADIPEKEGSLPTEVDESDLDVSANATIPARVVRTNLEMVIEVDPEGKLDPKLGVVKRIPESGRAPVPVDAMPDFDLTVIPFLWEESPDSAILAIVKAMADDPEDHELLWATHTLVPIADMAVTAHAPVVTSTNHAPELLRQTRAIQLLERGSGYYMGMMSGRLAGSIRGAAYVPGRTSFSAPNATTMAHEFGHNLGLLHAPCGGPTMLDPWYPFPDGRIGAWGYDYREGGALVPPRRRDLMSYCSQRWIGDYHFANALRYRLAEEDDSAQARVVPARSLLLWGGVDAGGRLHLEPALATVAPPALPASGGEYTITGRTGGNGEVFSLSFEMPEAADGDGSTSFAFVLPLRQDSAADLATITLTGPEGSFTLQETTGRPLAVLRDRRTGRVRGILRGPAADLAVRSGAARVSDAPDLEVLTSRGIPGPDAWR